MPTRDTHFPLFDALRGIAAVLVFTNHALYQPASMAGIGDWWWRFGIHTDVAVPIFLAISGFLLYRPFVRARMLGGRALSLRGYAWRRFLRIAPAYWVALTVIAVWFWADMAEVRTLEGALRFYGFAQIYSADTALEGIGQAWTLGVEVAFYALLGLLAWVLWRIPERGRLTRLGTELAAIAALCALGLAWNAFALSRTDPATAASLPWLLPLPGWLAHLAMGMLLAVLSVHAETRQGEGRLAAVVARRPGAAWAAALAFFLGACYIAGPDGSVAHPVTDVQYLARHVFYAGFIFFLLAPAVFGHERRDGVRRLLAWRPLAFLGVISYSFYLFHLAVLRQQASWWWDGVPRGELQWALWYGGGFALAVAAGTLGFKLVEAPAMRLKRFVPALKPAGGGRRGGLPSALEPAVQPAASSSA